MFGMFALRGIVYKVLSLLGKKPEPDLALNPDPNHQNVLIVLEYVNDVPKENGGILQSKA